jgi:hypothetical protein
LVSVFTRISLLAARRSEGLTSEGVGLARHETDFRTDAEAPLSLDELLALLGSGASADERSRQDAIACYLSGGDGWRDAVKRLGGAFAEEKLREEKAD